VGKFPRKTLSERTSEKAIPARLIEAILGFQWLGLHRNKLVSPPLRTRKIATADKNLAKSFFFSKFLSCHGAVIVGESR
jgi:hypothetical protein